MLGVWRATTIVRIEEIAEELLDGIMHLDDGLGRDVNDRRHDALDSFDGGIAPNIRFGVRERRSESETNPDRSEHAVLLTGKEGRRQNDRMTK